MTRPLTWAFSTAALIAVAGSVAADRLSRVTPSPSATAVGRNGSQGTTQAVPSGGRRTLTVRGDRRGHFTVEGEIDGRRLTLLVDTGASIVALTHEDAAAAGIRLFPTDYRSRISTANGAVEAAPVRLREVRVGDILVRDVDAVVMPAGRLGTSLLGMSFLRRLQGFDIAADRLTLRG